MATTGVGFRWLDILEKEFDKACVELDTSLSELETEEPEVVFSARQKIATLSSCFAQLTHKALTIFQNSAKLEAELVDMRAELVQARAANAAHGEDSEFLVPVNEGSRARAEAAQLARENAALRETVLALHSELFGARLATKYLDKELAGRIQQLQLLGRDMRAELRDSLWAQVEAEILLQRHKTLVRVCRGVSPRPARPPPAPAPPSRARPRTVRVRRSPHLGLGISVTGGREHGVPILISELEAGGPAALSGDLYVGDAILAINDVDLTQACHKEAVQALQSVKGDCALCVQFIATDDDDRLSEDNYRFPLYPEDGVMFGRNGDGATPTAPRTPDYTRNDSDDGSGSECESPYRPQYPDYNSINNNLAILDMDDDSIKIETRLDMVESTAASALTGSAAVANLLPNASLLPNATLLPNSGLLPNSSFLPETPLLPDAELLPEVPSSARSSVLSTPVHTRRVDREKKRRPQDWRTKGAYRRVGCDDPVSDDTTLSDGLPESPLSPGPTPPGPTLPTGPTLATGPAMLTLPPTSQPTGPTQPRGPTLPKGPPQPEVPTAPLVSVLPTPAPTLDPPREPRLEKPKTNGETKPVRRESKGFRIGSARRVMESIPLTNGSERKFPALLTGDGDPDFGTPV